MRNPSLRFRRIRVQFTPGTVTNGVSALEHRVRQQPKIDPMNAKTQHMERRFKRHIEETQIQLPALEAKLDMLNGPAQGQFRDRLHQVEVMEHAAERNIREVNESPRLPNARRVRKLRKLCRYIEHEAEALRHEAEFMEMGPTTTLDALVDSVDRLIRSAGQVIDTLGAATDKRSRC